MEQLQSVHLNKKNQLNKNEEEFCVSSTFKSLQNIIANGLRQQFKAEKERQMYNIALVSPTFMHRNFFRFFIYHIITYMILGPFSGLVLICFEPMTALKSMAFLPQGKLYIDMFFGLQIMVWMGFVGSVGVAIYDR